MANAKVDSCDFKRDITYELEGGFAGKVKK
jgi:hypothetical protein